MDWDKLDKNFSKMPQWLQNFINNAMCFIGWHDYNDSHNCNWCYKQDKNYE